MTDVTDTAHLSAPIALRIAEVSALMRAKLGAGSGRLGAGGGTLAAALRRASHRLPRRIRGQARLLARAEEKARHPKLCLTLDAVALGRAADEVAGYLKSIDLADRRKGWWLGMLGGLAFNVLAFVTLLVVILRWRGFL
ncbi:hypothetical protein [Pseudodonghicola xiamenensis]|uniref:hypothetical protein n=1 Tax=Pseudodonghicola xiamenensis TaxID=337702 RepID=UPI0012B5E3D8|nr:hypothetical protein [Pseudodonghicola xiamenensis]